MIRSRSPMATDWSPFKEILPTSSGEGLHPGWGGRSPSDPTMLVLPWAPLSRPRHLLPQSTMMWAIPPSLAMTVHRTVRAHISSGDPKKAIWMAVIEHIIARAHSSYQA